MRFSRKYISLSHTLFYWEASSRLPRKGVGKPSGRSPVGKDLAKGIAARAQLHFAGQALRVV